MIYNACSILDFRTCKISLYIKRKCKISAHVKGNKNTFYTLFSHNKKMNKRLMKM